MDDTAIALLLFVALCLAVLAGINEWELKECRATVEEIRR